MPGATFGVMLRASQGRLRYAGRPYYWFGFVSRNGLMPYYRVILEGRGIKVEDAEGGPPIIGFFTTHAVRAHSVEEAEEMAKAMVLGDWTTGEYASANQGGAPVLKVESVYASSWWRFLRFKNKGHSFFTADEEDAEQAVAADRRRRAPADR